jgi:hypothetical protein
MLATSRPAAAAQPLGTGNASLLGGDLSDPTDTVELSVDPGEGKPEEEMIPKNAKWVKMACSPASGPHAIPHQRHPYQSWQGAPAAGIFMNKPEQVKWYVDFKEGGYGGPSREDPYYCAIELKDAFILTHFTITTGGPDMPDRDPKQWAIQGSNTGDEDDWTDLYVCNATNRSGSIFTGTPFQTFLLTSFDSAGMAKAVTPADAKKIQDKLKDKKIEKADFARPAKAFTHFRIAIYSCFNPSAVNWIYKNTSGSLHLGQLELFGVPGVKEKVAPKVVKEEPITPPSLDAPFIISYWCGPSKEQSNLERIKEIAECGFTVAQSPNLWEKNDAEQVKFNLKFLDLCQQAGIKAFIYDGRVVSNGHWEKFQPSDAPAIQKDLDGMIADYSKHPGLMGFVLGDEMGRDAHPRLGFVTQYLLKKDPTHVPYYNLLPNYANTPKSYERMVTDYLKVVRPVLFSWDAYWQMHEENELRYYFDNLEVVRRNCLKAKVPFNQIIVSLCHMGYRECSEGDLRWQVWTTLAYGSRGIQYFTYVHVLGGMTTGDSPGLLAKDMSRDRKWFYVQKINQRIAKLGPTLVKLTSTGVYHSDPPVGTVPLLPEAPVKKIDGGSMVVGCFKDAAGKVYILPVNKHMNEARTFTLTLDDKTVSTSEVSQETGAPLAAAPLKDKVLEVKLEAGEGRLFLLNSK